MTICDLRRVTSSTAAAGRSFPDAIPPAHPVAVRALRMGGMYQKFEPGSIFRAATFCGFRLLQPEGDVAFRLTAEATRGPNYFLVNATPMPPPFGTIGSTAKR
jgi:hypothetical protein